MMNQLKTFFYVTLILILVVVFLPFMLIMLSVWYGFALDFYGFSSLADIVWLKNLQEHFSSIWVLWTKPNTNVQVAAEIVSAIGTFGVMVFAVYKDHISRWFNRPKLSVSLEKNEPYVLLLPQSSNDSPSGNSLYVRIRVENEGKTVAKNVGVTAFRIKGKNIRGSSADCVMDMFINPSNDGSKRVNGFSDIQAKTALYWDLGSIAEPLYRKKNANYFCKDKWDEKYHESEPAMFICLTYPLSTGRHILGPGKYELSLRVSADEIASIESKINIDTSKLVLWPKGSDGLISDDENRGVVEQQLLDKINIDLS